MIPTPSTPATASFTHSPVKASHVIGRDVVNPKGENLGDIKEVMLDPGTGRIVYAVVAFGGFLGMGDKLFAVPFSAFAYDDEQEEYVLDVPKEQLKNAPGFDAAAWPSMAGEQWNRDVYSYYGAAPYWEN